MKKYKFILVFFLSSISLHVYAKTYGYSGQCRFNGNMDHFQKCLNNELVMYDKELNKIYHELIIKGDNMYPVTITGCDA